VLNSTYSTKGYHLNMVKITDENAITLLASVLTLLFNDWAIFPQEG
jgi:hypothetical protein